MKHIQLFEQFLSENQFKGIENIPDGTQLKDISSADKLKIIQTKGNIIDFKVPAYMKRNFLQVISDGKIKKTKNISGETVYTLPGRMMASPSYSSIEELIDNVDWESMEQTRRFNL